MSGRMKRPSHIVVLAQDRRRHVCRAGAYGGEAEAPSGIFLEGDSTWGDLVDGAGDLIYRGSEVAIVHPDDRFACLLDALHDLLVFDLQFGVVLGLSAYLLAVGVVLPRVGSYIGQDGQLVDVRIVFGIGALVEGSYGQILIMQFNRRGPGLA